LLSLERGKIIMRNSLRLTVLSLAAAALLLSTSAFAATATGNLAVTAFMNQSCLVGSTPLTFGNYDVIQNLAIPLNAKASVSIVCSSGAPVIVTLDAGTNYTAAALGLRALKSAATTPTYLSYSLYSDTWGGQVWGDTGTTSGYAHTIAGPGVPATGAAPTAVVLPVYGSITMGQTGAVGPDVATFTDTVVITAIF
jgi:spore coat protein U-like protein